MIGNWQKFSAMVLDNKPGYLHGGHLIDRVGYEKFKEIILDGVKLNPECLVAEHIYWNETEYRSNIHVKKSNLTRRLICKGVTEIFKILFHIDEEERWNMVVENVKNTAGYLIDNSQPYEIEVVANGKAVKGLLKDPVREEALFAELKKAHIKIAACRNAINKFGISEKDLMDGVQVVAAGIIEIAQKQQQGFSYIKP